MSNFKFNLKTNENGVVYYYINHALETNSKVKHYKMQLIVDRPEVKGDTERKGVDPVGGMKRDQAIDRTFHGHSTIYGQIIALM